MSDTVDGDGPRADHPQAVSICPIDKKSVHRICSGQVVLTLATAVKELLENSIDAGATIVEIKLKDYGSESIEVSDNGAGVESSNFEGLTLKHHTSKLQDFGDLVNVETFGFRGEALSSLCALCEMCVTTRHRTATVGTKLVFDNNGRITKQTSQARQVGTTVTLQNLFYTLPVRHKEFKRNLKKEFVKLVHILNSYCIISTGVRISCTNQTGKGSRSVVVSTNGNANLQENISSVYGPKQLQSVLEFVQKVPGEEQCSEFGVNNNQSSIFSIDGLVSKCDHGRGRSSSDRQFLFINGRPFDSTKLTKVVNEVYHQYNRHQYPFVALRIKVERESVDVNVTPDKRQVFLEREKHLLAIVKASLIALYEPTTSMIQMQMPMTKFSSIKSGQDTEEDHNFTRLTKHHSLEKPDGMSSLMKLKRSFSSAFAKEDRSMPSATGSPRTPVSSSPKKQRRMDSFVSSFTCAPEKLDDSLTNLSPKMTATSKDCIIVPHTDSAEDNSSGFLVIRGIDSKRISESEINTSYQKDLLSESENTVDIDETGDASSHSRDSSVNITDCSNSITKQSEIPTNDKVSSNHGLRLELHHYKPESEEGTSTGKLAIYVEQDTNQCEETGAISTEYQTQVTSSCRTDTDTSNKDHQDNSTQQEHDVHDVDQMEEMEKCEKIVFFSPKLLQDKLGAKRDEQSSKFSRAFRATITPGDNQTAEQELQKEITKDMFAQMEILGQFNKGFIITRLDNDLFIVDQHATDEKYNFETLQRDYVIQSQRLICPQNLELTASNEIILMDNLETFRKNGFEFVIDENAQPSQRVKLKSTPVSKNWHFGKEDIEEMIFMLSDCSGTMCRPSRVRAMFASRACRKSIMIGTTLNKSEMKKLVCHMGDIEQPWNCPHGRPTMRHLINLDMVPK